MGLLRLIGGKRTRVASALSVLGEAAMALYQGKRRLGMMLLGVAVLMYRWSPIGWVAYLAMRYYRKRNRQPGRDVERPA